MLALLELDKGDSGADGIKPEKRRPYCRGRSEVGAEHGRSMISHGKTGGSWISTGSSLCTGNDAAAAAAGDGGSAS